jgi:hypothetical protein
MMACRMNKVKVTFLHIRLTIKRHRRLVVRPYHPLRNSGPINAILLDHANGTMWGGSSDYVEDYGIGW